MLKDLDELNRMDRDEVMANSTLLSLYLGEQVMLNKAVHKALDDGLDVEAERALKCVEECEAKIVGIMRDHFIR